MWAPGSEGEPLGRRKAVKIGDIPRMSGSRRTWGESLNVEAGCIYRGDPLEMKGIPDSGQLHGG